jgi:hypothetical protein
MATGWKRPFDDPIPLPNGRQLVTLEDAGDYMTRLPQAEQQLGEWQTAIACLIGAAEGRDFLMHARIGVMRAINRHVERCSTRRARTIIGDAGSWRGISDGRKFHAASSEFDAAHHGIARRREICLRHHVTL